MVLNRVRAPGVLCLIVLLILAPAGLAQTSGAVLAGRVADETGAALPGVTVTATNDATGVSRSVVTGSDGSYRTPTLLAGRYTVTAELSGFARVTVPNVELNVAATRELDLQLKQAAEIGRAHV
jgi:hypothetical protein